ncbi:hypothetical protein SAMN05421810_103709 [Amycolatopsis arida]|uniref:Uncharacterized protein n=2 Tax=Amycolatopsis arida TaxID=587909 RepID=A0A1I5TXT8_9PSEU|nr:hypothetical protein CLV69_10348 [Amycolatopsis arida]SFP87873.1 hypothetical protein SAMN05421810_103709 [Amycolatopsis arida]
MVYAGASRAEFVRARDRLLEHFVSWANTLGRPADLLVAQAALDFRFNRDGLLGRWTIDRLRDTVLVWFPRKLILLAEPPTHVLATVAALLDYLGDADLLDERSDPLPQLHRALDEVAPEFTAAMADPRNFGVSKFWATTMAQHGVDPTDPDAAERFMAQVRIGATDVDPEVLATVERRRTAGDPSVAWNPPPPVMAVQEWEELGDDAARCPVVIRLRRFVEWVDWDDGCALTPRGDLAPAVAAELARLPELADPAQLRDTVLLAKALWLVRARKGRLYRVRSAAPVLHQPFWLWRRAVDKIVVDRQRFRGREAVRIETEMHHAVLVSVYSAGGSLTVDRLEEMLRRVDGVPKGGMSRVTAGVHRLAEFGLLDVRAGGAEMLLLPLGAYAVRELLGQAGLPVIGLDDLARETAEVLVARLAPLRPELFERGIDAWLRARDQAIAIEELTALARRTDDLGHRVMAYRILDRCGTAGTDAVAALRDHSTAGPSAAAWLVNAHVLPEEALTERERRYTKVDAVLSGVRRDGEDAVVAFAALPASAQLDFLDQVLTTGHPGTAELLRVFAVAHPDPDIAEAAERALVRFRAKPTL